MDKFLEIRNSINFDDNLPLYENRSRYSNRIKEINKELDNETKKYIDWDLQLLYLSENILHTTLNKSSKRLGNSDHFEEERSSFYKALLEHENYNILKIRYTDYLIDKIEGREKYVLAQELICSLENLVLLNIKDIYNIISPISRLVDVCVKFNMKHKIESSSNLILEICNKLVEQKDIRWTLELSQLQRYLCYYKNEKRIPEQNIFRMIEIIEIGIDHFRMEKNIHLHQSFIWELVNWYRSEKYPEEDMRKNIQQIGELFEFEAEYQGGREKKSSLVEAHFLEEAIQLYSNYGFTNKVNELKHKIRKAYERNGNEMQAISFEFSIPNDELEKFYSNLKGDTVLNTFLNISHYSGLIQDITEVQKRTEEAIRKFPLSHLMGMTRIDKDRKVFDANDESNHMDFEFHTQYNYGIITGFSVFFMFAWQNLINDGLTSEMVKERVLDWDYFDEETRQFIGRGLERFWHKDYISALHILVPQFENAFRYFFHYGKYPTTVIRDNAVQQEQTFNQFLEQDFVKSNIPENFRFFIKYIMVDELGYNLRNNIAHGIARLSEFTQEKCLIVIYAYFILTLFGWDSKE